MISAKKEKLDLTEEAAAGLGLSWPAPLCACGCGRQVSAYKNSESGKWTWRKYVLTTKKEKGHSPKRSVRWDVPVDLRKPSDLLGVAYKAYLSGSSISERLGLKHASVVCTPYLGGFRIEEALPLRKAQFREVVVKGRDFVVIEGAAVEKSSGRTLDRPIVLDDLMFAPLKAWLDASDGQFLLPGNNPWPMTTSNAELIVDKASGGRAWPHMFRAVRTSFLRREFRKPEVNEIMGWADEEGGSDMSSWYGESAWEKYALPLHQMTVDYWANEESRLPADVKKWVDELRSRG